MKRGVKTGNLGQARERLGERSGAAHIERLVRGLHHNDSR
jgi:hypothetical protein